MKLIFRKIKEAPLNLMRRAGYGFLGAGEKTGQLSLVRRLSDGDYPRFHVYVKKEGDEVVINLHLDQKSPSYEGAVAHSGEYEDSEILQKEAERIRQTFGA